MISPEELEDLEKAEQQIDQFISKRAKAKEKANAEETSPPPQGSSRKRTCLGCLLQPPCGLPRAVRRRVPG